MKSSMVMVPATLGLLLVTGQPPAEAEPARSRPAVVLELFTSQGCSSCPAADRVLSRLGSESRDDGLALVPLAYHVDYWNRIGWVDPFSSGLWSARQRNYAGVFGLRAVYTPQIVLNGRTEIVGSREARLRAEIPAAVSQPRRGRIEILDVRLLAGGTELVVELAAEIEETAAEQTVANLAVFENGLVTRVESGENARRTLENDYVVRLLRPTLLLDAESRKDRQALAIALDPSWVIANLGVAAFLQEVESLEIHAAATLDRIAAAPTAGSAVRGGS